MKIEPENPPLPEPLIVGVEAAAPNAEAPPEEKLKPVEGGCGLKPVLALLLPKAGNEEFANELLGVEDWAGGKLLVAALPKAPPFAVDCDACAREPKGFEAPVVLLLSPKPTPSPPKLKPEDCIAPKLVDCERP